MIPGITAACISQYLTSPLVTDIETFFTPTIYKDGYFDLFEYTRSADNLNFNGYNVRILIPTTYYNGLTAGSGLRVTMMGAASGGGNGGCAIDSCYIGHQAVSGDPFDFDGTQVQMFSSASGTFTVPNNSTLQLDNVTYAFNGSKSLVIAVHINSATDDDMGAKSSLTGMSWYTKSAAAEAANSNVSGYTQQSTSQLTLISKIQVQP